MHHGVRITDAAIVAAATLSNRYIADRFLPDKAIDLIDEAASRQRMQVDSKPEELDELDRRIIQLKIEQEALRKETDAASRDRLTKLGGRTRRAAGEVRRADRSAGRRRRTRSALAQKLKEELEAARNALAQAQRKGDYAEAGRLAYGVIPDLEKKLAATEDAERRGAGRRGGDARPCRAGRLALDRRAGRQDARGRARQAAQDGRASSRRRVVGQERGGDGGFDRGAPRPRRPAGPEPADRLVHVPRARPASARPS